MTFVNFCKKCKREVPMGETCPYCFGKLAKTNEYLSFWMERVPARDWFAWNQVLRVALPVLLFVAAAVLLMEGSLGGGAAVQTLFLRGFFWVLVGTLGAMLLLMWVVFLLQGKERMNFVLDKEGAHAYTHLEKPTTIRLYARFLSHEAVEALGRMEDSPPSGTLIRRVDVRWADVKKVRFWKETGQLLFFRPGWWQVLVVTCPPAAYADAEAFARKRLGRNRKVKVVPKKP